ncbi:MAG: hypothetical protein PHG91_04445 [Syntrophales bacterium]|nr:hypothetical protein [Syntrophales bacterium]MDD5532602.1 hypothetical protein [Syntrophales bacterium]
MKQRIITAAVCLLLSGALFSCAETEKKPGPGDAVLNYVDALARGRADEAAKYLSADSPERKLLAGMSGASSFEERFLRQGMARYVSCEIGRVELLDGGSGVEVAVAAPDLMVLLGDLAQVMPAEQDDNLEAVVSAGEAVHHMIEKYRKGIPMKKTRGWFRLVREGDSWKIHTYRKEGG